MARRDGERRDGGCPFCSAYVEVVSVKGGHDIRHDDDCPVLTSGDRRFRHMANIAATRVMHPGVRVLVVTELEDGSAMTSVVE